MAEGKLSQAPHQWRMLPGAGLRREREGVAQLPGRGGAVRSLGRDAAGLQA